MFAFSVTDDSMAPLFRNGDYVTLDPGQPVAPGDFVIAFVASGDIQLRRLHLAFHPAGYRILQLRALNPAWPAITVDPRCLILGKVVAHTRRL